ncbi:imidazole glycerol phosphate synthase subunit HisF [Alphaproteobacteria bacterium]|nr:imidazole glycerol phosphate synthase subunit HisF [Alphaproteobacteria bacterium]
MLKNRIIPCLDVKDGKVVKGINFKDLTNIGDPVIQAKIYDKQGADELCFLDINASHENRDIMLDVVRRTADQCFIPLTVGGGVKNIIDIKNLLRAGADKVSINTAAVENPEFVKEAAEKFGTQCIVVAIDTKKNNLGKNKIFTHGGRRETKNETLDWAIQMTKYGAGEILLTSMDKDGTKSGFDLEITSQISNAVKVPVIASGGVGTLQDLADGIIHGRATGVLAASIFHYGEHTIQEAKLYMNNKGVPVRMTR